MMAGTQPVQPLQQCSWLISRPYQFGNNKKEGPAGLPFCRIDIFGFPCYNKNVMEAAGVLEWGICAIHRHCFIVVFCFPGYKDAKNRKNEAAMFWAAATFIAWIFVRLLLV
jgi:hypothetical protein